MNKIHLRKFKEENLIFAEEETVIILKFIFKNRHDVIDQIDINNRVRAFAQGLLLEAVDASYALGFVEALVRSTVSPGAGAQKVLKKFGKKALQHWFDHATAKDLMQIKIYERVREQLDFNFGRVLIMYSNGTALNQINHSGFVAYGGSSQNDIVWA